MTTGPQSMPVFNDSNLSPEAKRDIIAFLNTIEEQPKQGGLSLGSMGPVSEGLFAWIFGLGIFVACAVWLGSKGLSPVVSLPARRTEDRYPDERAGNPPPRC
jgi:ubiquinol-cytochrome c reductase cytochrome c subunit